MTDPATHTALLRTAAEGFAATLAEGDPSAPVPTCPGWTLTDLGRHLEAVHRWARTAVQEARDDASVQDDATLSGPGLVARYRSSAGALVDVLERTPASTPCWTFGPPPGLAAFWRRRQVFETLVHLLDARRAVGSPDPVVEPEVASDGVDEVGTMFFPRQVRLHRMAPLGITLRLVARDVPGASWTLAGDGTDQRGRPPSGQPQTGQRDGQRDDAAASSSVDASASVTGTASDLLWLVWKRLDLDEGLATGRLTCDGEVAGARNVLRERLTP